VILKTLQGVVIDSSTFVPMNSAIVDKNCFVYGIGPEGTGREDSFECNVVMDEGDKLVCWRRDPANESDGASVNGSLSEAEAVMFVSFVEFDKSDSCDDCYFKIVRTSNYRLGMGVIGEAKDTKWTVPCCSSAKLATIGLGDEADDAARTWFIATGPGQGTNPTFKSELDIGCHRLRHEPSVGWSDSTGKNLNVDDERIQTRTLSSGNCIKLSIDTTEATLANLASSYVVFFVKAC